MEICVELEAAWLVQQLLQLTDTDADDWSPWAELASIMTALSAPDAIEIEDKQE